jgi:acyl carrier protein
MMRAEQLQTLVLETLKQVAPEIDADHLDPAQTFREQVGIDSIDFLNFVMGLEERLGLRIAEVDYPQLSTLNGCLRYLQARATLQQDAPFPGKLA